MERCTFLSNFFQFFVYFPFYFTPFVTISHVPLN